MTEGYGLNAPDRNQPRLLLPAPFPRLATREVSLGAPSGRIP